MRFRVSSLPASSTCPASGSSGDPESPFCGLSLRRHRVSPIPASTTGSMIAPRSDSNLAPAARPPMCFRAVSGTARRCLALDTLSISSRHSTAGLAGSFLSGSLETCIFLPDLDLRFQLPARSPTGNTIGLLNLCTQVQKTVESVDFTRIGATIFRSGHIVWIWPLRWSETP